MQRPPQPSLILHSDRGSQFASAGYRKVFTQNGLVASMSRPANCYDNVFIESFFLAVSNTKWSPISASLPMPRLAPPSLTISRPFTTAPFALQSYLPKSN